MKRFLKIGQPASFGLWLLVFIGWLAAGCASSKHYAFSPLPVDSRETCVGNQTEERLAVGDVVIIRFSSKFDQIPPHEESIQENGSITLPLIGEVKAADKTTGQLQREIYDLYLSVSLRKWNVTVEKQRFYYVGGQVNRPGRRTCSGEVTILKAIESAGGFTEYAARRRVELVRVNGDIFRIDCRKAAQDAALDLPVYPGDKIVVPMIQRELSGGSAALP